MAGHGDEPAVISRREWGADETLRLGGDGRELWPAAFSPVQKLLVHHTAGENRDPDPAETIRAVYYYHAVTQGWGDIGYNFIIDAEGRLYEGRYSVAGSTDAGELPDATPGEDDAGRGVTGAHAYGYNSGTVGTALLGNLNAEDAQPAARETLERLLAWKAEQHGLDPRGEVYTNPVTGASRSLPNIAAHRDVVATDCPGAVFYETLPQLRDAVGRRLSAIPPAPAPTPAPSPEPPLPTTDGSPGADSVRSRCPNLLPRRTSRCPKTVQTPGHPPSRRATESRRVHAGRSSGSGPGRYAATAVAASGSASRARRVAIAPAPGR